MTQSPTNRWWVVFTFFFSLVFMLALESSADAQARAPRESARTLHTNAQQAYGAGRYEVALELWQRAYALEPRAGLQFNLSQCFGRLGRLDEESTALRTYLEMLERESPERLGDAQANSARQRLIAIDERQNRTGVEFEGLRPGDTLVVDERAAQPTNGRLRLAPGPHAIRVERDGFDPFRASVSVVQGAVVNVTVVLVETQAPLVREVLVERTENGRVVRVEEREHRRRRRTAFGLLGGGGASLIAGTTLAVIGLERARDSFDDAEGREVVRRFGIPADVSFGLGAAMVVSSIIVFRVDAKRMDERAVRGTLGPASIGLEGRF